MRLFPGTRPRTLGIRDFDVNRKRVESLRARI